MTIVLAALVRTGIGSVAFADRHTSAAAPAWPDPATSVRLTGNDFAGTEVSIGDDGAITPPA